MPISAIWDLQAAQLVCLLNLQNHTAQSALGTTQASLLDFIIGQEKQWALASTALLTSLL